METYGEVEAQIQVFLTSAPVGGEWSASGPEEIIIKCKQVLKKGRKNLSLGLKAAEPSNSLKKR
jgi:hypothetical protein